MCDYYRFDMCREGREDTRPLSGPGRYGRRRRRQYAYNERWRRFDFMPTCPRRVPPKPRKSVLKKTRRYTPRAPRRKRLGVKPLGHTIHVKTCAAIRCLTSFEFLADNGRKRFVRFKRKIMYIIKLQGLKKQKSHYFVRLSLFDVHTSERQSNWTLKRVIESMTCARQLFGPSGSPENVKIHKHSVCAQKGSKHFCGRFAPLDT